MNQPHDIDVQSVEFYRRMYEQAAVDREFRRRQLREVNERAARAAFVERIVAGMTRCRWSTLEICLGAIAALAAVTVTTFAICEIMRLIRTYGF
jgi:hypothetical protein